ncbi:unnamed protein product [Pylaiella littoralis]
MYRVREMRPRQRLPRPSSRQWRAQYKQHADGRAFYLRLLCSSSSVCDGSGGKRVGDGGAGSQTKSNGTTAGSSVNERRLRAFPHRPAQAYAGEDRCWYASTLQLQLASLGLCEACRDVPMLSVMLNVLAEEEEERSATHCAMYHSASRRAHQRLILSLRDS